MSLIAAGNMLECRDLTGIVVFCAGM